MPTYDYQCKKCETTVEVTHSIKQDALEEFDCPTCNSKRECKKLISVNCCDPVFKGSGWTVKHSGFGARGYIGKNQDLVRPIGTPVDAPSAKHEADMQFQRHIDSGGLEGIKPAFDLKDKNDPRRPRTGEEVIERVKRSK